METIWFFLWTLLWAVYFILDGFDLGMGSLMPFLASNDHERRVIYNAQGPYWDGNEVWLITAGGVTFAAFPNAYAVMFSALYAPLLILLFCLIFRAVAFEFRGKGDSCTWIFSWDVCMTLGSFLPALLLGVAFANLFMGIPIDGNGVYHGNILKLLNPYGLDNYFKYLLIGYISHQFTPDFRLGLLSVTDFQEEKVWDSELDDYNYNPDKIYGRSTVGLYLDLFKGSPVSALIYGYGQFGKLNTGQHVTSGLVSFKMKYNALPKLELQLGYDFVSGDWMAEDFENKRGFSKFLGSTHSFLGIMDFFNPGSTTSCHAGLHQPLLSIIYRPAAKHSLELTGRYFWSVASPDITIINDAWGQTATTYSSHNLGFEGSLIYKYKIRPDLSLEAGYALHAPTDFFEIMNEIMPGNSKFAHFGYIMISYKPTLFNLSKHLKRHND